MIVVTGGAGFIGANLVHALNARGCSDILVVDDFTDGRKFANLDGADFAEVMDAEDFLARADRGLGELEVACLYHLGACAVTTEWNGRYVLRRNYEASRRLLEACAAEGVPFVYASSAAVYGTGRSFTEVAANEHPVNPYGWSKLLFDQWLRRRLPRLRSPAVGLRFFNVYGPREAHKDAMASVVYHFAGQLAADGRLRLFGAHEDCAAGEQRRDFVHVDDVCAVLAWFGSRGGPSGIYNVGTGQARTFNELAGVAAQWYERHTGEHAVLGYVDFPPGLAGSYQSYTQADLAALRQAGCEVEFRSIEVGVPGYLGWLVAHGGFQPTDARRAAPSELRR